MVLRIKQTSSICIPFEGQPPSRVDVCHNAPSYSLKLLCGRTLETTLFCAPLLPGEADPLQFFITISTHLPTEIAITDNFFAQIIFYANLIID